MSSHLTPFQASQLILQFATKVCISGKKDCTPPRPSSSTKQNTSNPTTSTTASKKKSTSSRTPKPSKTRNSSRQEPHIQRLRKAIFRYRELPRSTAARYGVLGHVDIKTATPMFSLEFSAEEMQQFPISELFDDSKTPANSQDELLEQSISPEIHQAVDVYLNSYIHMGKQHQQKESKVVMSREPEVDEEEGEEGSEILVEIDAPSDVEENTLGGFCNQKVHLPSISLFDQAYLWISAQH